LDEHHITNPRLKLTSEFAASGCGFCDFVSTRAFAFRAFSGSNSEVVGGKQVINNRWFPPL